MVDDYDKQERIAIRMDSHISEREAIRLTDQEYSKPECINRFEHLRQKVKENEAAKHAQHSTKFNYSE